MFRILYFETAEKIRFSRTTR